MPKIPPLLPTQLQQTSTNPFIQSPRCDFDPDPLPKTSTCSQKSNPLPASNNNKKKISNFQSPKPHFTPKKQRAANRKEWRKSNGQAAKYLTEPVNKKPLEEEKQEKALSRSFSLSWREGEFFFFNFSPIFLFFLIGSKQR